MMGVVSGYSVVVASSSYVDAVVSTVVRAVTVNGVIVALDQDSVNTGMSYGVVADGVAVGSLLEVNRIKEDVINLVVSNYTVGNLISELDTNRKGG
jgi:hypothetical protein